MVTKKPSSDRTRYFRKTLTIEFFTTDADKPESLDGALGQLPLVQRLWSCTQTPLSARMLADQMIAVGLDPTAMGVTREGIPHENISR